MRHLLAALALMLAPEGQALAHAGHDRAPGDEAAPGGVAVELSDAAIRNLGIETSPAALGPLSESITMPATIEYLPERYANITAKASGSVSELDVKVGDRVGKGQKLLTFAPVFIGSSPVALASPIDGYVVRQNVVIGQSLTPETVALEIADTSQLLARGVVYAPADAERIRAGQDAAVSAGRAGGPLSGAVQRLDVGLSKDTRAFAVYALIDNPRRLLLANAAATLSVSVGDAREALTVPSKAVLGELGEYFVFVREGERFERRSVVLGRKAGERIEIIEGVLPDEQVVTVGNYQLQYARPAPAAGGGGGH